eukprot:27600-Rhodomonas_salina.1
MLAEHARGSQLPAQLMPEVRGRRQADLQAYSQRPAVNVLDALEPFVGLLLEEQGHVVEHEEVGWRVREHQLVQIPGLHAHVTIGAATAGIV